MSPRRRAAPPGPTEAESLTDRLRARILSGQVPTGTPLREEAIAEENALSRHTVRSALAALLSERIVVQEPYRGMRVATFADDDLAALQDLRCALESEAVRILGARHGSTWPAAIVQPMVAATDAYARAVADPAHDWAAMAEAHAAVHRSIVTASGSERIIAAHRALDAEMQLLLVDLAPRYSAAGLIADHDGYVAAIQHDGPAAVRRHIDAGTTTLRTYRGDRV